MESILPFLPGFAIAYGILLVGASSPGPAVALLIGISVSQGRSAGLVTCAGIATGSATINVLTILGVGLILSQAAWAMMALKFAGSAYLMYLAYGAFRKAIHPPPITAMAVTRQSAPTLVAKGYLLQITNPKAIAFWLAIAAVGATQGAPLWVIAAFVSSMWVLSFGCHAAWAFALSASPVRAAYQRSRRWIEGTLGAFFAFAAFKLATARG
ncbi:MAG: LysE family translocator [Roseicyclus sp.]|nr:LysE family translocator [Roseicyclus sp.]